jgi:hypothetical protein
MRLADRIYAFPAIPATGKTGYFGYFVHIRNYDHIRYFGPDRCFDYNRFFFRIGYFGPFRLFGLFGLSGCCVCGHNGAEPRYSV